MKIACVIDSLGSGGAQRQLATLAVHFKRLGHDVSLLTYHPDSFFVPMLASAGVEICQIGQSGKLRKILALRKQLRVRQPDVVLAFLQAPALYCELAGLPSRKWGLVVSERSQVGTNGLLPDWKQACHRFADYVTTNSHSNRLAIQRKVPALTGQVATIYNLLDLSVFRATPTPPDDGVRPLRMVVAAGHREVKNAKGLVRAVDMARRTDPGLRLTVDWYGRFPDSRDGAGAIQYFEDSCKLVHQFGLDQYVHFHESVVDIAREYETADAVVLTSFMEGLPNAVCEGMACGRPILSSRIGDAEVLVKHGTNGLLFNPREPEDMARVFLEFCRLSADRRAAMGAASRALAEELFEPDQVLAAYSTLLGAAAARKRTQVHHWPEP